MGMKVVNAGSDLARLALMVEQVQQRPEQSVRRCPGPGRSKTSRTSRYHRTSTNPCGAIRQRCSTTGCARQRSRRIAPVGAPVRAPWRREQHGRKRNGANGLHVHWYRCGHRGFDARTALADSAIAASFRRVEVDRCADLPGVDEHFCRAASSCRPSRQSLTPFIQRRASAAMSSKAGTHASVTSTPASATVDR